jgi:ankyrin repeat protein
MSHVEVVGLLLDKGAKLDTQDERGDTALHYAVMVANLQEVKLLVAKGANVNIGENDGLTPLMLSIVSASPEVVKLLLDNGAKTEAKDSHGFTALMAASGGGLVDLVRLLLSKGANINAKSDDGTTPLSLAVKNGKTCCERTAPSELSPGHRAPYSVRSACMGSMDAARRAGIQLAARATKITSADPQPKASGSVGFTP